MKKLAVTFACLVAGLAFSQSMDEIDMVKVSERRHPMSDFHTICIYKPQFGRGGNIRITVDGMCPLFIRYNVVTNTWSE